MKTYLLLFFLFISSLSVNGQEQTELLQDSIQKIIHTQLTLFPQEKVHLHLDRDHYSANDTIWFRAYVLDAYTHRYQTGSRYVYVDLISPTDTLVRRVMIRPEDNMHYGYIPIPEQINDGEYTIRAYTRYMRNMGEDYLFQKKIRIAPLTYSRYTQSEETKKTKKKQKEPDYEVYFFPEGGQLLDGRGGLIAFKTLDENGNTVAISGQILDSSGNEVAFLQSLHAGMGVFNLFIQPDESYTLHCTNELGLAKTFPLPAALPNAHTITCQSRNNKIYLARAHSFASEPEGNFYLLAHSKGEILLFNPWDDSSKLLILPKEDLPGGIVHFLLLDGELNVLSERLYFSSNYSLAEVDFQTSKPKYNTRQQVSSELTVSNDLGMPVPASLSVSVIDGQEQVLDSLSENILSYLLLSSELPGYIENPGYYFQENTFREQELNLLMLTHGWRRYNLPEVIKGKLEQPSWGYQRAMSMTGQVKGIISGKPVKDANVVFLSSRKFFDSANTNDNGLFAFVNYELPEGTSYFVQAKNKKGGARVELLVDPEDFPTPKHLPVRKLPEIDPNGPLSEKAEQRMIYDEQMRMIYLNTVEVKAKKRRKQDENMEWYSAGADYSITREKIDEATVIYAYE
ncbi:hypothetical protein LJB91_03080, partial [Bacteroidales bacterium OttesenSCG-928-L03]|nr:hypothetical protein [Bacteroidales bacterium OttesenSCG-928-L03]